MPLGRCPDTQRRKLRVRPSTLLAPAFGLLFFPSKNFDDVVDPRLPRHAILQVEEIVRAQLGLPNLVSMLTGLLGETDVQLYLAGVVILGKAWTPRLFTPALVFATTLFKLVFWVA